MKKRASFHRFLLCLVSVSVVGSCSTVDPGSTTTEDTVDSDSAADADSNPNGNANGAEDGATDDTGNDNADPPSDNGTNGGDDAEPPPADNCGNEIGSGNEIVSGPAAAEPPVDNDTVFRSLVVDVDNASSATTWEQVHVVRERPARRLGRIGRQRKRTEAHQQVIDVHHAVALSGGRPLIMITPARCVD